MSAFLEPIARAISDIFEPLSGGFKTVQELETFLHQYGWDLDSNVDSNILLTINDLIVAESLILRLQNDLNYLFNSSRDSEKINAIGALIATGKDLINHIDELAHLNNFVGLPSPLNRSEFWSEFSQQLIDDLMIRYFENHHPLLFGLLHLTGVIQFTQFTTTDNIRLSHLKREISWDNLGNILTAPKDLFEKLYQWNQFDKDFNHTKLLKTLAQACIVNNFQPILSAPRKIYLDSPPQGFNQYISNQNIQTIQELEIPIINTIPFTNSGYCKLGLALVPVPDISENTQKLKGLLIRPSLQRSLPHVEFRGQSWGFRLNGAFDSDELFQAIIYPNKVKLEMDQGKATLDANMEIFSIFNSPYIFFGSKNSSRLEIDGFSAKFSIEGERNDPDIRLSFDTGEEKNKVRLIIATDSSDGFIQKLIGEKGFTLEFGINFLWSSRKGISFDGAMALEFQKYLHVTLGPFTIDNLIVQARTQENGLDLNMGAGISGVLGPVALTVENIGLKVSLQIAPIGRRGAFGPLDFKLGFKPPNGVGLSIDVGIIKGGGYLYCDPDKGEYAGALEFLFSGFVNLKAIGLINTQMPDGSKGFSLLIIITTEFGAGIQLGFGFTLIGVGGLLGLNRTMRIDQLAIGMRSGDINSILFPENVVANASRIVSDLRVFFPPANNIFLIGPMAKLGWGTPTLISLSLGIIIEIPGNVVIVGVLALKLPSADQSLLVLQVNFIGTIEFDKKRIFFFAALFESRILSFTIDGEMGTLGQFGDDPNFLLTVGGFHPRIRPALPFPTPKRICLNILDKKNARIHVDGYFAITSNTVQFGAHADLYFGFSNFRIDGYIGFDTLFRFSPFYFIIETGASVSIKVFGAGLFSVHLEFALEGPAPWRAHGRGSISLLFFDVSADFDITWGTGHDTTLPSIQIIPILTAEVEKLENWKALLPERNKLSVTLRKLNETTDSLVLHPIGKLQISQRSIPLEIVLDKVGNQKPADAKKLSLRRKINSVFTKDEPTKEKFAPAQFKNMKDAEKLSRPAYTDENAGIMLDDKNQSIKTPQVNQRSIRYEQITIDTRYKRLKIPNFKLPYQLFQHFLSGNASAQSKLSNHFTKALNPRSEIIKLKQETFAVANIRDNTPFSQITIAFASESLAREFLQGQILNYPNAAEDLHVIPSYELSNVA